MLAAAAADQQPTVTTPMLQAVVADDFDVYVKDDQENGQRFNP